MKVGSRSGSHAASLFFVMAAVSPPVGKRYGPRKLCSPRDPQNTWRSTSFFQPHVAANIHSPHHSWRSSKDNPRIRLSAGPFDLSFAQSGGSFVSQALAWRSPSLSLVGLIEKYPDLLGNYFARLPTFHSGLEFDVGSFDL